MRSWISLLGLYNYDNSVLDGLTLPENFEAGDLETLKDNLLMETAELEILYPDITFLKYAITKWSSKQQLVWKELRDTQLYEYNPIWNADYKVSDRTDEARNLVGTNDNQATASENATTTEHETFNRGLYSTEDATSTQTDDRRTHEAHDGEVTTTILNHVNAKTGDDTTTNSVFAYNDNSNGQPREEVKVEYGSRNTENGVTTEEDDRVIDTTYTGDTTVVNDIDRSETGGTTTDKTTNFQSVKNSTSDTDTTEKEDTNTKYERWLRGNYGQTTTQKMIEEQRELVKFNLLDYIIQQFKERFCIMVY